MEIGAQRRSYFLPRDQLMLAIDFIRPSCGYNCYRSHMCCHGGLPKGVTMKGGERRVLLGVVIDDDVGGINL